jgi:Tol biopolymer transport system component/DNA-binding winged helix-turn-helix (wHTH) protein
MEKVVERPFRAGDWRVEPELNTLSGPVDDETAGARDHHLEPKVMAVLLALAAHPNQVVHKDDLIATVWPDTFVSDDVLIRCISILRRVTVDDAHHPRFIQTVPKVGYRLVAPIAPLSDDPVVAAVAEVALNRNEVGQAAYAVAGLYRFRWSLAAVVALVVVGMIAAAAVWSHGSRAAESPVFSRTLQFTSGAGEQTQPALAPDGRGMAFVVIPEDGGTRRIYLKQIGSEAMTPLGDTPGTSGEGDQYSPAWSPDGRQIAYFSRWKDQLGLYVADVVTHATRRVYIPQEPSHWEQGALSWFADGLSLVFPDHVGSQPNSEIFRLNLVTGETRAMTSPPPGWEGDLSPAVSPDGQKIAFTRASETAVRDIWWITPADGKLHQLTHDHTNIDGLTWSADSASVIFSSNRGGKYALWQVALTGAAPRRLTVGTEDAYQPTAGWHKGQLAYTQGSAIWSIAKVFGGSEATVLSSTQQDSAPALSPDARWFAIQSLRSGSQEIWIASIDGTQLRQLTFLGGPLTGSPAWSHDGQRILFDSRPDTHSHIFMVPAGGGQPRQFTFGNGNDIIPRFSHDDATVYFRSNRAGRWQLFRMPASGGQPQPITSKDGIVPQESPDGRYLYYARGDEDGLWRIPVAGGAEEQVLNQPSANFWGYWQVTRMGIFYLDRTRPSPEIRLYNPDTGQNTLFATLKQSPPTYAGLTVSADGRLALMTGERGAGRHITLAEAQ